MSTNQPKTKKSFILTTVLPLAILAVVIIAIMMMLSNKPEAMVRKPPQQVETVEVEPLELQSYQVFIDSYGNIEASTSSNLVAQVSGQVVSVANNFETGLPVKKGQELLQIDDRDYVIEVRIARAEVANAQLALNEEKARGEQALRDWNKINANKQASDLVLRKPQLASAQASLDAASARLEKAKLALSRTKVIAPYDGYVIKRLVSEGELINSNTPVATIFANDSLEVRLPIPSNKVQFLANDDNSKIKLQADFAGNTQTWVVDLDRSDSVIDEQTRQWFVTAKLPADFLQANPQVKVGQFVSAQIEGALLHNVAVVPSLVLTANNEVFIFSDNAVYRRSIRILWQDDKDTVIDPNGSTPELLAGDLVVTSKLNFVADGAQAKLKEGSPNSALKATENKAADASDANKNNNTDME